MKMSIFQPFSCVFLRMIDVSDIAWKDLPGSAQMLISKISKIGQETCSHYEKKNQNWNDRMNDFTRNLNDHFKQHRTLYAEEKNIANKEKIEDRRGLWNAYSSPSAFYKTSKTLYISGTGGCDGSLTRDIMDDLLLVPTRNVHHSEKYKHVIEELEKSPEITRLVGHNLASAVIRSIKNNLIHLLQQPMLPLQ